MAQTSDAETEPVSPVSDAESSTETDDVTAIDSKTDAERNAPLPLDQVFSILKNQRRRRVLRMLQAADGQLTLSDLAEQIAAWENDKPIKQITSGERKRVYVGLYQCHLPKMDGMNVIDFNKPRGIIELGDNMEIMYKYLDTGDEANEPEWHRYSMALSLFGAVGLGTALLAQPLTTLPVLELVVIALLIAFTAYALICLNWARTHDNTENADIPTGSANATGATE